MTEQTLNILSALDGIERRFNVRVLYACEAGSRAWGHASTTADYDVRFIYVHPKDWYLTFDVERQRDVIDQEDHPIENDLDFSGWDIRKVLYLFTRTNGGLLEWIHSPIVYKDIGHKLIPKIRELAHDNFDPTALCYHYSHMARGNAREYLLNDQVRLKKYFYVLRPLMAIRYIQKNNAIPPVNFEELTDVAGLDSGVKAAVHRLLELKRTLPELGVGPMIPELNRFIEAELDQNTDFVGQGRPIQDILTDQLNDLFRYALDVGADRGELEANLDASCRHASESGVKYKDVLSALHLTHMHLTDEWNL